MITTQAQVALANQALRSLGEKPIALPYDETNPRWLLAQEFYDQTQDDLLTAHFWNFATVRAVLTPAVGVTPAYGWAYAFALPSDYLAIQRVQTGVRYQREGAYFLADESTLPLTYTARLMDVTRWPAFFTHAFVAHLTAAFAEQVTGQTQKAQLWLQLADKRLARAKGHDSQEGTPPILQSNDLILARRGGWRP
jgi:hypothetical protein